MAAARFLGEGRIELEDRPVPRPSEGEILVKVDSCALCGTDRGLYLNGSDVTPGHESSGTVVDVGSSAHESLLGGHGVIYLVNYCGECSCCLSGNTNMCLNKRAMYGFTAAGGYAQYVAIDARCWLPVDPQIPLDGATALLDLLGTSGHAFRRTGRHPQAVAVIGCGPIGMGAISVARTLGAGTVYAIDISSYRLELANQLGATAIDGRAGDPVATCLAREPNGFDTVVEAAGYTATQHQAIALAAAGGTVVFLAHNHEPLPVATLQDLIQFERALLGSEYFPIGEFEDNLSLLDSGLIPTDTLITHKFSLEKISDAFELFMSGRSGKILVRP